MNENVLFVRSEEDDDDDPWDDTLLIKAYDAALARAKKEVLKSEPGACGNSNEKGAPKWRRGHFCRAKYSEDNEWYEANILKINGDSAFVRYVGYGNSENILLKDLEQSNGNGARRAQKKQAKISRASQESGRQDAMDVDASDSYSESGASSKSRPSIHAQAQTPLGKSFWREHKSVQPPSGNVLSTPQLEEHMPPPPPPPPGLFHGERTPSEDETFNAMLMSWYMSGYHTGYYEGRKSTKVK